MTYLETFYLYVSILMLVISIIVAPSVWKRSRKGSNHE